MKDNKAYKHYNLTGTLFPCIQNAFIYVVNNSYIVHNEQRSMTPVFYITSEAPKNGASCNIIRGLYELSN